MTPNPATMTVEECMDFVAMIRGWSKATRPVVTHKGDDIRWYYPSEGVVWFRGVDENRSVDEASYYHPLSPTLDAAAAAMPEGWRWYRLPGHWAAHPVDGWHNLDDCDKMTRRIKDTNEPTRNLFQLVVACMMAEVEVGDE